MKKAVSLFIAISMLLCMTAYGAGLDFLTEMYPNYTAETSVKLRFESSEELAALINEIDFNDEIENYVDLKALLKSLLSNDSVMTVQVDMSDDMKVMKAAVTAESSQFVEVNANLSADVKSKTGIWVDADFSDEENPSFTMIYSHPFMNKYLVIDLPEAMGDDFDEFSNVMEVFLNPELIKEVNSVVADTVNKHADVKASYGKCVINIDNDALLNIAEDLIKYYSENLPEEIASEINGIDLSGIKLLGENGIQSTYILKKGKISSAATYMDIELDLKSIYSMIVAEEWPIESQGVLSFSVEMKQSIKNAGKTKVEFPELTDENSISFDELYGDDYEYEEEYPLYVYSECDYLPIIDGETYVPLRQTMEEAYEDTIQITYENGTVTLASENFIDFKTLSLKIGSDKAVSDTGEYTIKAPIVKDGVSYVATSFFEDVLGWSYNYAWQDVLNGVYYYSFDPYTYEYEPVDYPYYYVSGSSQTDLIIDGEIYVPLRETIVDAYDDSVNISFEKGVIKLESECFPGFKTITLTNGSDKAYTENGEYNIGNVFIKSGTTYVNKKLFEDVLGWELTNLTHYIEDNDWYYEFVTE